MSNDDYLWDKSGETDPEVVELERALSKLASRPRQLGVVARSRRPVVVTALVSAAAALAIGLGVGYRFGSARTEVITAIATESVPAAALASQELRNPIVAPEVSLSAPASARTAEKPDDDPLMVASAPLTSQQIQRVVSRHTGEIRRSCWQPALANARDGASTRARIDVSIVIAPEGRVDSVTASPDSTDYPGLASCIVQKVRGWRFPAADGKTHVKIPFVFAAG